MQEGKVCLNHKLKANGDLWKLSPNSFYVSLSPKHKDGLTPICKDCCTEMSMDDDKSGIDLSNFQHMLQLCDKPYKPELYKAAYSQVENNGGKTGKCRTTIHLGQLNKKG